MSASTINQKIWNMATVLYNDGVSNSDYLEQLTYLLFLKMADEYSKPPYNRPTGLPEDCRWECLAGKSGAELFDTYKKMLDKLGAQGGMLQEIFTEAQNKMSSPAILARVIQMIGAETWTAMSQDVKGDIYEGLLQRIAEDTKSGAGQYFTPRPLINTIVKCVQPKPEKTVCDPCCGSGGFLLAAKSYIEGAYQLDADQKKFLKNEAFHGWEIVPATRRLCLMNLFLHNIGDFNDVPPITRNDALLSDPGVRFDYVLTNPPFGKKATLKAAAGEDGELVDEELSYSRQDFWATSSNKQLNFVQHIHTILKTGGTAAVVVPDNVLFEGGAGETVRRKLLETTNLHTILRLPTGIFYKPGVKANVIFFENRPGSEHVQTREVWIYDYRTNVHHTLKQHPMTEADLADFLECYKSGHIDERDETYSEDNNPDGRWRRFTIDEIMGRDKLSLDITWIKTGEDISEIALSDLLVSIHAKSDAIADAVEQLEALLGDIED